MLEGARQREKEQARLAAWQVATMLNMWGGANVTVEQLMDDSPPLPGAGDIDAEYEAAAAIERRLEERDAAGWVERLGVIDTAADPLDDIDLERAS